MNRKLGYSVLTGISKKIVISKEVPSGIDKKKTKNWGLQNIVPAVFLLILQFQK